ncbi:hypothetical protein IFM89_008749 [Coptis chinensis]|uniref:Uncharacterized protein n=1 Tax=Coptis chinensis TaxID=261450 RepID=A0A835LMH3_9MAGN|nr:hypothetical protein IFM89_008749 [Coptis chinensis]
MQARHTEVTSFGMETQFWNLTFLEAWLTVFSLTKLIDKVDVTFLISEESTRLKLPTRKHQGRRCRLKKKRKVDDPGLVSMLESTVEASSKETPRTDLVKRPLQSTISLCCAMELGVADLA